MEQGTSARTVTIRVTSVAIQGLAGLACLGCGAGLDVCQPDANQPDRLLATCPDCRTWYLIEASSDQDSAWIASLEPLSGLGYAVGLNSVSARR